MIAAATPQKPPCLHKRRYSHLIVVNKEMRRITECETCHEVLSDEGAG